MIYTAVVFLCSLLVSVFSSQPGGPDEPVRVVSEGVDLDVHDGRLRPAIGVENIQVMRANRTRPELADRYGWTYNHAPMLAYWNGKFYLEYLSNPFGEHLPPGQTLVATSSDGRNWDMPKQVFPIYLLRPGPISGNESGMAMMHQRMGFYVAPNGRLLVLAFYGHAPSPWGATGIGRVVEATSVHVACRLFAKQSDTGRLEIEVLDHAGHRPVRIVFGDDGRVRVADGSGRADAGPYKAGSWYRVEISVNAAEGRYDVSLDGKMVVHQASFAEPAANVERLSFRTGEFRTEPTRQKDRYEGGDLPAPDDPVTPATYYVDDVSIK